MLKRTFSPRRFFLTHKSYVFAEIKEKPKKHTTSGHQGPATDMSSGGPLMARRCVLAGWRPYDSRVIKRRQHFVSKYLFVNLHLTFSYIVGIDVVHVYSVVILYFSFLRS